MPAATVVPNSAGWKRLAIISVFGGAGFALVLACIGWYVSRPGSPVAWKTGAVVAIQPPGFSVATDGKRVVFSYTLQNTTTSDYNIAAESHIRIMARTADGTFVSLPFSKVPFSEDASSLSEGVASLALPIYVPAKEKAIVLLFFTISDLPGRANAESDAAYHERVRDFLNRRWGNFGSFVIFDESNHYEIALPKWLSKRSEKK